MGHSFVEKDETWYWFTNGNMGAARRALDTEQWDSVKSLLCVKETPSGEHWRHPGAQSFPAHQGMIGSADTVAAPVVEKPVPEEDDSEPSLSFESS